jgi:hypothetical protein
METKSIVDEIQSFGNGLAVLITVCTLLLAVLLYRIATALERRTKQEEEPK